MRLASFPMTCAPTLTVAAIGATGTLAGLDPRSQAAKDLDGANDPRRS